MTPEDWPVLAAKLRQIQFIGFDFDGVFTDNGVYVFEDGREAVRCCRADGIGLTRLKALNRQAMIISTEVNPVVSARAAKLKIPCLQGVEDKQAALAQVLRERQITPNAAAFVGNDVNDLACLQFVGLPIVVQDAHPDVLTYAHYRTHTPGGQGAVREVCDLLARALSEETAA